MVTTVVNLEPCLSPLKEYNEFSATLCIDCLNTERGACKPHSVIDNRVCVHDFGPFEVEHIKTL